MDSSAFVRGNYIKVLESYTKTTVHSRIGERLKAGRGEGNPTDGLITRTRAPVFATDEPAR